MTPAASLDEWPSRDLIDHRAATSPEAPAVVAAEADRWWTYGELDDAVDRMAAGIAGCLPENGSVSAETSHPGPRVGVLLPTRVEVTSVFHAVLRLGGSVVALDPERPADDLADRLDRTDASLVVCGAETATLATEITDGPVATLDEAPQDAVRIPSTGSPGSSPEPAPLTSGDEALIAFTSGTTGRPKAVRLTVGNLVSSATASAFRLGVSPDDRWLCCLPTAHVGGLSPIVRSAVYGSTVVVQREFDAERTATVMDRYHVTGVSLVPTQLRRLLEVGWTPPASLRFVLLGGAPAGRDLLERALERDVPVHPTYGTTETASQIATATPAEVRTHPETVGRPLVVTDVTVVADGNPVEPGERGEIVVSGPTVTPGYLDDDATGAAMGPHGFETGDLGYRDEGGRLWVTGRVDDRIVTGGENVAPGRVATAIEEHPAVSDAAVVGVPDEEWGERMVALVVAEGVDAEGLRSFLEDRLAGYEFPKSVLFAEELPRTASGTVDRSAVREHFDGAG